MKSVEDMTLAEIAQTISACQVALHERKKAVDVDDLKDITQAEQNTSDAIFHIKNIMRRIVRREREGKQ